VSFEWAVREIARVEGRGGLYVRVERGELKELRLDIYEPPRFFEALLVGRNHREIPDLLARICGLCPASHQMAAVYAIEQAWGVEVDEGVRALRRLMRCAEWISNHASNVYYFALPDFFGCRDILELARKRRDLVKLGLRVKKVGDDLMAVLGGRAVHPISLCVGGFYLVPSEGKLRRMAGPLREVAKEAEERFPALEFPEFEADIELLSLRSGVEYPMNFGRIISSRGLDVSTEEFRGRIAEIQVPHSTSVHVRMGDGRAYLTGPLARVSLNGDMLPPELKGYTGLVDARNPYTSTAARCIEILYALGEALRIIEEYKKPPRARADVRPRGATAVWALEAPRGMLHHTYELGDDGKVLYARIIPPTEQNLANIEENLKILVSKYGLRSKRDLILKCEMMIRSYDPCISCATHSMRVEVDWE